MSKHKVEPHKDIGIETHQHGKALDEHHKKIGEAKNRAQDSGDTAAFRPTEGQPFSNVK